MIVEIYIYVDVLGPKDIVEAIGMILKKTMENNKDENHNALHQTIW